jgi:hypothetical protein
MPPSDPAAAGPILDAAASANGARGVFGLLFTPFVVGVAAAVLPHLHVGEPSASIVVYAGASSTTLAALAIAAGSYPPFQWRLAATAIAGVALAAAYAGAFAGIIGSVAVSASLVAAAWAIGTSIGRHIEHPGHLLPACVVVACADIASVVSQFGPTRAMAESEVALSLVTVGFPVPGTSSFAPALGVGDLVFIAIVFGALAAHRLSLARAALLCALGTAVAGTASAVLGTAVPALVPIAAAVIVGVPEARMLRPRERRVATLAMVIAVSVAAAAIASQLRGYLTGM